MTTPPRPRPGAAPREAQETARVRLRELLRQGPATARELSERAHLSEKEVRQHLEHLIRSAKTRGEQVTIEPARCEGCSFVFEGRDRVGKPGRCPVCRGSRIRPPRFSYVGR
jgi:predicted Zn-ribbon and HTH transcriptional regulator